MKKRKRGQRREKPSFYITELDAYVTDDEIRLHTVRLHMLVRGRHIGFELVISGFDNDSRELYQIPEAVRLCQRLVEIGYIVNLIPTSTLLPDRRLTLGAFEVWLIATGNLVPGINLTPLWHQFLDQVPAITDRCLRTIEAVRTRNRAQSTRTGRHPLTRLDSIISAWEDYWHTRSLLARAAAKKIGRSHIGETEAPHCSELRTFLTKISDAVTPWARVSEFSPPPHDAMSGTLMTLPSALTAWCCSGRCAYHLMASCQQKLDDISLPGLSWTDIPLPYASFAVTFDEPIQTPLGNAIDLVLVSVYNASSFYPLGSAQSQRVNDIRGIPRKADHYQPLTTVRKDELHRLYQRGQWQKLAKATDPIWAAINDTLAIGVMMGDESTSQPILGRPLPDFYRQIPLQPDPADAMSQLVARLGLYLEKLPASSIVWEQPFLDTTPADSLVHSAHVCTLA